MIATILKLVEFLRGKKTYIVGLLTIVLGVLTNDEQMIMTGLGMMTLRAGISNSGTPSEK